MPGGGSSSGGSIVVRSRIMRPLRVISRKPRRSPQAMLEASSSATGASASRMPRARNQVEATTSSADPRPRPRRSGGTVSPSQPTSGRLGTRATATVPTGASPSSAMWSSYSSTWVLNESTSSIVSASSGQTRL